MNKIAFFALMLALGLVGGCGNKKEEKKEEKDLARISQKQDKIEVKAAKARLAPFEMELVSNGKVNARRKAVLAFITNDVVRKVHVKNGEDTLDERVISKTRLENIKLQIGYTSAVKEYEKAVYDYSNITVYAPFDGVIADLEVKEYNQSSAYKEVCSVIDDATMEIVFNVLETEIAHLKAGMEVEITPYANDKVTLKGTVTEVNPKIDENGMVKVRATTDNPEAVLVDGMNVSILAKRQIADKLIVPKTAVLPRQGRKVVFVYENGRAIWKYVETGFENSREVCIESGLKEGEEAIYENNLGLSHECEVTLINKKE